MKTKIKVYEPAMCCPTGMCGPTVDEKIVAFNDLLETLRSEDYDVERFNLAQNAAAFQSDETVLGILKDEQLEALPITMVEGRVIKKGAYPTLEEIKAAETK